MDCPDLTFRSLHDFFVKNTGLATILLRCPNLTIIILDVYTSITDIGVSAIAHVCPQLRSIDISYCDRMTDAGISTMAPGCPHLTFTNLDGG